MDKARVLDAEPALNVEHDIVSLYEFEKEEKEKEKKEDEEEEEKERADEEHEGGRVKKQEGQRKAG